MDVFHTMKIKHSTFGLFAMLPETVSVGLREYHICSAQQLLLYLHSGGRHHNVAVAAPKKVRSEEAVSHLLPDVLS